MAGGSALVRPPGARLAEGIVTHLQRQPVDVDLAHRQPAGYVAALVANGWAPVQVAAADDCPDAVFVEDTVIVMDDVAVLTRPGAPVRADRRLGPRHHRLACRPRARRRPGGDRRVREAGGLRHLPQRPLSHAP